MDNSHAKELTYKHWGVSDPRCIFLLVHGLGAHAGRWEAMAGFFLNKGVASYAVELRSRDVSGKSGPEEDRLDSFLDKIRALYGIIAKDNPSKKIFLIGESFGAIISFLICADHPNLFRGLVCISPAFVPKHKMTFLEFIRMLAPLLYNPEKEIALPFDSSMCTRDSVYRNMMDKDTREYRSISSRFIFEIFLIQARAMARKKKMMTPALFLVPEEDRIVDPQGTRQVFDSLAVKKKRLVSFPGMYHSLSIELGKEAVFEEISKWTEERLL